MAKQKCGTCRYFQEAGLAGSGWCHHPQRKTSTDLKIFVRRNELACRDSWARNLWEPASDADVEPGSVLSRLEPMPEPLPPATPEHMQALVAAAVSHADAAGGEDVLLSEGRIVSELVESWQPPSRPFVSSGFDPRTAIFRAREAHRERARAKAAADRLATGAEAISTQVAAHSTEAERLLAARMDAGAGALEAESKGDATVAWSDVAAPDFGPEGEWPIDEPGAGGAATGASLDVDTSGATAAHSAAWDRDRPFLQPSLDRPAPIEAEICVPEVGQPDRWQEPAEEGGSTAEPALGPDTVGLPSWFQLDLPRICRVCRDFRPSADGLRGSCGNAWAFTHRRLVQADDSTPCRSAIGDWWVPVDDVWLVAADVSAHGRPTPLLDRLLSQPGPKRRRS